jgi:2-hydroxy-3-keto-5-methylthiopentenyl-1-phosphate phosphatase
MTFGKISEETDGWLNYIFWSEKRSKVIIHGDETNVQSFRLPFIDVSSAKSADVIFTPRLFTKTLKYRHDNYVQYKSFFNISYQGIYCFESRDLQYL